MYRRRSNTPLPTARKNTIAIGIVTEGERSSDASRTGDRPIAITSSQENPITAVSAGAVEYPGRAVKKAFAKAVPLMYPSHPEGFAMVYDQSVYYATVDNPGGPTYLPVQDHSNNQINVPRDSDGNMTKTGEVAYALAYLILFGLFLYFWFS